MTKLQSWLNKERTLDLNFLQWALPSFLSSTAIIFELVEHGSEDDWLGAGFMGEMIIFGFMGPIIIALILGWMRLLMNAEKQATVELQTLNRALENKVDERTAALEQRNTELAHANQNLQHLDEMKSEFVSLVSHELRAPLSTLNGGLELALSNPETMSPSARRTLETMVGESARLTKLVQTILNVSRLEAGKLEVNIGPVALRPLMEQAAEVILIPSGRPLEWKFSPDLPPVLTDEIHLEEILRNLMQNADKYSPAGMPIYLCACQEGDKVRISIKDHGFGVPKELQQYIFERFGRAHNHQKSIPGWGLGLYFARKLIEAQQGSIGINSPIWPETNSPGSEFYLVIPIAISEEE
ncbi:MAG: HAMP domain-containing sensor histidine kinase [Chloroflexi bacterium]|nr:HAMP domain-containing sensor histidine kinase [Chloroflexota bacterium]